MKKFLAALLASMMVASVVVGCGNNDTPTEQPSDDDQQESSDPSVDVDTDDSVSGTLKVAVLESAYGSSMWKTVASVFETIYPNVTVELTASPKIEDLIDPQIQSGDYPDVIHLATGRAAGLTESMRDSQQLRDLSTMLATTIPGEDVTPQDKIAAGFLETSATNPYSDGKTYMAPMFYSPCGLFYNKTILEANGWEFPTTWEGMWELGDKAKEKGIYLFTYPTSGYFDAFIASLISATGGAEMFDKAMLYEGWDSAEMTKMFEIVGKLAEYTEPTTVGNANNTSFTMNQQLVIDGKAICMPNGTWVVGEMAATTPGDEDKDGKPDFEWGMSAVPAVTEGQKPASFCWIEQMWSPKDCANPELADLFMAFCYSDIAAGIFGGFGAVQPIIGADQYVLPANALFYGIYNEGAQAVMGGFAATETVDGVSVAASLYDNMNNVVGGTMTVADWQADVVETMNTLKEHML